MLRASAWSAPVVISTSALPAFAASTAPAKLEFGFATLTNFAAGQAGTLLLILGNSGGLAFPAGATFEFTVSQGNGAAISRSTTLNNTRTRGITATQTMPPPQVFQSYWKLTLTAPVPGGTGGTGAGAFPLTNPTFALNLGAGSQAVHLAMAQTGISAGTTAAQNLPIGTWYDSAATGWWLPSVGNTYPTGITKVFRNL